MSASAEYLGSFLTMLPPLANPNFGLAMFAGADASLLETFSTHEFSFLRQGKSILTYLHTSSLCSLNVLDHHFLVSAFHAAVKL
jgi:hypothetical protein